LFLQSFIYIVSVFVLSYKKLTAKETAMHINLKDGRLYETADGRRFRVKQKDKMFYCETSFNGYWRADGLAFVSHKRLHQPEDNLIREVEEMRWVPVMGGDLIRMDKLDDGGLYRRRGQHLQQQITRAEAKARGVVEQPAVRQYFGKYWIEYQFIKGSVEVTTSAGRRVILSL
jgi:hypothetical protein